MTTTTTTNVTDHHCKVATGGLQRLHAARTLLICAAAGIVAAAGFAAPGCSGGDAAKGKKGPSDPVAVTVLPAKTDAVQRSVDVVGTLYGQEDAIISNKVPGKVIAIYKDIGDRVSPGEELAQLLKNDYQLTLNERQAALQEALAALGVSEVPPDNFDLETVPAVRRAQLQAKNAQGKLDRGRTLRDAKPPLISDQDFADLQTEAQVAQSAYDAALLDARAALGTARTRKAQVAIAEQALRDTTIRAPRPIPADTNGASVDGTNDDNESAAAAASSAPATTRPAAVAATTQTVTTTAAAAVPVPTTGPIYAVVARYSSEGELNAGITRMFRLVIDDPLKLRASVPERHAGRIQVGQKVLVRVEAEPQPFPGTVARINPQIDPANRSFEVEVSVANPNHVLKPGAFARAEIQTIVQPDVLFVPDRAVVSFAGVKKVYSVKDGKAVEIPIETGTKLGEWVEVSRSRNLKPGDPVVVEGVNRLAAGVPVAVKDAPRPATPPAPDSESEAAEVRSTAPAPRASADAAAR
jgi:RND family efflux transporter MFP subunit